MRGAIALATLSCAGKSFWSRWQSRRGKTEKYGKYKKRGLQKMSGLLFVRGISLTSSIPSECAVSHFRERPLDEIDLLKLVGERKATAEEWNTIAAGCDYATYFHSQEWAEIWHSYTEGSMRPEARLLTFNDGTEVLLPLSSRIVVPGLLRQLVSSPAWTYGGWLSLRVVTSAHHQLILRHMRRLDLKMRQNPYYPSPLQLPSADPALTVTPDHTHVLDLRPGFQSIAEGWESKDGALARKLRKARREGVVVEAARDPDEWREYFDMYRESQDRWGDVVGVPHAWPLFEIMHSLRSPRINLWLARVNGRVAAGALCFSHARHAVYWHGASRAESQRSRAANLLHAHIIEDACTRGLWWYDFNPSGGLAGVEAFKKSFGAVRRDCSIVVNQNIRRRALEFLKQPSQFRKLLG